MPDSLDSCFGMRTLMRFFVPGLAFLYAIQSVFISNSVMSGVILLAAMPMCGAVILALHRAIVFPILGCLARWGVRPLEDVVPRPTDYDFPWFSLTGLSELEFDRLRSVDERSEGLAANLAEWSFQLDLLYTTSWAILIGLAATFIEGSQYGPYGPTLGTRRLTILLIAASVCLVAALVSHRRYAVTIGRIIWNRPPYDSASNSSRGAE